MGEPWGEEEYLLLGKERESSTKCIVDEEEKGKNEEEKNEEEQKNRKDKKERSSKREKT